MKPEQLAQEMPDRRTVATVLGDTMQAENISYGPTFAMKGQSNVTSTYALDIARENARLERATPAERLAFAVNAWGDRLLFTSSFGAGSGVLLHLWSTIAPQLPVVFIDTGFLFDETLRYRDTLVEKLGLRVEVARPATPRAEFLAACGQDIMERDPDFCCARNKVEPLKPYLAVARGWVSGLRRDQGATRQQYPFSCRRRTVPRRFILSRR